MSNDKTILVEIAGSLLATRDALQEIAKKQEKSWIDRYKWISAPAITLFVILFSVITAWATIQNKIDNLETSYTKMAGDLAVDKMNIQRLEVTGATQNQRLISIQADVLEIKDDVKKLMSRSR
ncbi:MAG: hypothetical protein V1850_00535 [Candidatus Bathyarchaeota archaeon]